MSSVRHGLPRTSPTNARKTFVKAPRPVPSAKSAAAPKVTVRGAAKPKQVAEDIKEESEDSDDMATSFLQYCAMCEKQILVPNNSILYCSERCKRQDAEFVPERNPFLAISGPTTSEATDEDPLGSKPRDLVPRAQPTPRPFPSARIPPQAHEGKSDLDPTEWKPKLPHRPSSEAFSYLGQFHRSPPTQANARRPAIPHGRSVNSVPMAPSLSATPTTSTSSEESIAGTPYEFVARSPLALASRRPAPKGSVPAKPATAAGKLTAKLNGPAVAKNAALDEISYEKQWDIPSCGPDAGSLTTLLGVASLGSKRAM